MNYVKLDYSIEYEKAFLLLVYYALRATELPFEYVVVQLAKKMASMDWDGIIADITHQLNDNELNKIYTTADPTKEDLKKTLESLKSIKEYGHSDVARMMEEHFDTFFFKD